MVAGVEFHAIRLMKTISRRFVAGSRQKNRVLVLLCWPAIGGGLKLKKGICGPVAGPATAVIEVEGIQGRGRGNGEGLEKGGQGKSVKMGGFIRAGATGGESIKFCR